ncbi:class I SAM-dependent methyltransferase [Aquiflexum gelatinilyticum]|uniref:Class I SAM-dependent methyltransferase n=1 Tax=Aquiflexum gelatinilyticum TaxID=2961943 RepID=A0A9X2P2A4_9BACT|nr:class I SAM-dependent methyltransferase [Aquiflexum gelatinilyticum]MCR9014216.1 class I SAM-dependent methyltransferase [Aquiflexum gelatinilyticum]
MAIENYTDALKKFVQDHQSEDPAQLLFAYSGKTDFDLKAAVQQIQSRQKAKHKLPSWSTNQDLLFPVSLSLEQASSEETARYKSALVKGKTMIDLTGGFGVDTFFLSENFQKAVYCERNGELAAIVKYNFDVLKPRKFEIVEGDSLAYFSKSGEVFDLTYVDPARRGEHNQKLYKLADCEPDIVGNWRLLQSKSIGIMIKASPMLDIKQALHEIPEIQKVWVISVKNEVKEVLLHWEKGKEAAERIINAVDLQFDGPKGFSFTYEEEESSESIFGDVGKFLIEPYASVLKAGAFRSFGKRFGLKKLHPNSHLYTCEDLPEKIPGRIFEVIQEISNPKKELKQLFPVGKVNVITRNYALSADELKKKYKLQDGGKEFLIGTRVGEKFGLFYCRTIF